MKDVAAKSKKIDDRQVRQPSAESTALQRCYGAIGISAVAAAVRYQGAGKNQAYAPAVAKTHDRASDAAA